MVDVGMQTEEPDAKMQMDDPDTTHIEEEPDTTITCGKKNDKNK